MGTRIAIVGCGQWGMNHLRVFQELEAARPTLVCDPDADRLRLALRRVPGLRACDRWQDVAASDDFDAVVVATPAASHFAITYACLTAGKHVLVEKPLATCLADAETLVEAAERAGRVLVVGHTFLFNAGIRKLKELIDDGGLGRIYYLRATRTNMGPVRTDVNSLWDLAAHDIAIFQYLLGRTPQWVSAVGARLLDTSREDVGFATLSYPGGVIANVHSSWLDPNKVREVVIVGSQRRIVFDDLRNAERVRVFEKGLAPAQMEAESFGEFRLLVRDGNIISPWIETSEPLRNLALHFLRCVTDGADPLSDGRSGAEVVRVLEAIDRSLVRHGAPVEVGGA